MLEALGRRCLSTGVGRPLHMYLEDVIKGRSLLVEGVPFRRLCKCLEGLSGVTFTARRRFFWSALNVHGEFVFHGHAFKIEALDLNRSFLVSPKEPGVELQEIIAELRAHVAQLG